ncbi:hypothetical protein SAZ11_14980 [Streptomyces sp. FXJ1.4098]|uniref:hypothetical protein n=1 Tax=Streptomyces sp. NPDC020845 TaxID=3365096 RepID=UPI0029930C84|nr:hypothetical protein [Streptomyces sp. FXJ1.4098]
MTAAEQRPAAPTAPTNGTSAAHGTSAVSANGASPPGRGSGGDVGERPGGGPRPRRWLKAVVVFLLITIPAGYMVISALQSRNSGEDKQENASATGLTAGWPSKVQRRIYDVWIPGYSDDVAFYETNSWKTSSLYVQFVTSVQGLDRFLVRLGTDRAELENGRVTIDADDAKKVGWRIGGDEDWAGMVLKQEEPQPELDITVDFENRRHPKVYVVSTVTP